MALGVFEEGVSVPKLGGLVEGGHLVSHARVLQSKLGHLVHVPLGWLKLNHWIVQVILVERNILFDILKTRPSILDTVSQRR